MTTEEKTFVFILLQEYIPTTQSTIVAVFRDKKKAEEKEQENKKHDLLHGYSNNWRHFIQRWEIR